MKSLLLQTPADDDLWRGGNCSGQFRWIYLPTYNQNTCQETCKDPNNDIYIYMHIYIYDVCRSLPLERTWHKANDTR